MRRSERNPPLQPPQAFPAATWAEVDALVKAGVGVQAIARRLGLRTRQAHVLVDRARQRVALYGRQGRAPLPLWPGDR